MYLFFNKLKNWYQVNKRDLPWRNQQNPYKIWISEIILQQTRVDQGLEYYHRFLERFPDVKSLADASEEDVLKLWQGLGYYSRARNLHHAACQIRDDFGGKFPNTHEDILKLKGVGAYTAAAIASFAFDLPYPVLDGNVARFITRLNGIYTPIDTPVGQKELYAWLNKQIDPKDPATFNQAVMEFGAIWCKPANPLCDECPFNRGCYALKHGQINELPAKKNKTKVQNRYMYYFVPRYADFFFIKKRTDSGIWKNMYDFPLLESEAEISSKTILKTPIPETDIVLAKAKIAFETKHQLSHRTLYVSFIQGEISSKEMKIMEEKYLKIQGKEFGKYPHSRLIELFFEGNI